MIKNFLITLLLCGMIASTGCMTYSETLHTSLYHGTDDHAGLSDFYYLQYGVSGSASASYNYRGGGYVREGLLAEAKRNLMRQYPLGPNQAYANVAIDDLHTSSGLQTTEGRTTSTVVITVVISADIIQYGTPPPDYKLPADSGNGKLSTSTESTLTGTGQFAPQTDAAKVDAPAQFSANEEESSGSVRPTESNEIAAFEIYDEGQQVLVPWEDKTELTGVVKKAGMLYDGTPSYKVEFSYEGKVKTRWFSALVVRKFED